MKDTERNGERETGALGALFSDSASYGYEYDDDDAIDILPKKKAKS